jgi:REP element-mobilizing transposase RayT
MARQIRIEFAGAFYHVMNRGNNGDKIFFGKEGQGSFLKVLSETCQRTGWIVHAYVLMGNHYHLLIETPEANLVAGMKWLQGTYTQRVNVYMKRRGHLFQGRYKAQLVNADTTESRYFQTVADYIHLNPARAKMTGKGKKWGTLKDYPWSSLPAYCLWQTKRPRWLEVRRLLETYSFKDNALGRESYLKYLEAKGGKTGKSYKELERGWCLGDGDFRQQMLDKAEGVLSSIKRESVSGSAVKEHNEYEAEKLLPDGISKLGLAHADLAKMSKSSLEKKALAAWLAKHTMASGAWIATRLMMGHPSSVTQAKAWCRKSKEGQKWLSKLDP